VDPGEEKKNSRNFYIQETLTKSNRRPQKNSITAMDMAIAIAIAMAMAMVRITHLTMTTMKKKQL
jgi:hypothetical protein